MCKKLSFLLVIVLLVSQVCVSAEAESTLFSSESIFVYTYNESIVPVMEALGMSNAAAKSVYNDLKLVKQGNGHYSAVIKTLSVQYDNEKIVIVADISDDSLYKNIPFFIFAYAILLVDGETNLDIIDWLNDSSVTRTTYTSKNFVITENVVPHVTATLTITPVTAGKSNSATSEKTSTSVTGTKSVSTSGTKTQKIDGITINELPYNTQGLQITAFSANGTKATVTVKNNTGYAIDSLSSIEYKCYNNSGIVLKSGNLYLENLNNGESCKVTLYMESGTT